MSGTDGTNESGGMGAARRYASTLALVAAIALAPDPHAVRAAEVPGFEREVGLEVREQPVEEFVQALFRELGVPVIVHAEVEGAVNGRFEGPAASVFAELTDAFDLVVYHDGALAHVYLANAVSRTLLPLGRSDAARVRDTAIELGLPDARNLLSAPAGGGLLATGTPRFLEQVGEIVESVAVEPARAAPRRTTPAPPATPGGASAAASASAPSGNDDAIVYRVFPLRHAWADDTLFDAGGERVRVPGVVSTLQRLVGGFAPRIADAPAGAAGPGGARALGGVRRAGDDGAALAVEALRDELRESGALSAEARSGDADEPSIVADTRTNSVVVRDRSDRMDGYARLIERLDRPSGMIEIEATIIDVLTDRAQDIGVNWRYTDGDGSDALFGAGNAGDAALSPGAPGPITPVGRGGVLSLMLGEPADFLARIRLLEERGAAKVVSRPHVITLSDIEAVLSATTEFFVRVAGDEEVELFSVPVGTTLRVTPHAFDDVGGKRIKLLVRIDDGSQVGGARVDNIPVIERASLSTQAVIDEGDSLLIGGLVRDSYRQEDYRVPLLGSVPVLGRLFRSTRDSVSRVERLFLITPRVSNGTGFGPTADGPRLEGRLGDVTADAGRRLEGVTWPGSPERGFEPLDAGPSGTLARSEPIGPGTTAPVTPAPDSPAILVPAPRGTPDSVLDPAPPPATAASPDPFSGTLPLAPTLAELGPRTSAPTGSAARRDPVSGFTVEPWPAASADTPQR